MKIAIDISPLKKDNFLKHRVRGAGFYIENLRNSLEKYLPQNNYLFLSNQDKIPRDVDVVHYPFFEPFFLSLPFFRKHKTIVTVHDLTPLVFPKDFPAGIKGGFKWQIQKMILKGVDAIITDSFSSKRDIVKYVGVSEDKVHVVYLASANIFKQVKKTELVGVKKKYNLPDKFVLYVGDVTWNKNLPRLIRAVEKLSIPLVLVGKALVDQNVDTKNPWNKDLIEVKNLIENSKKVVSLGFVPNDDLVSLYNLATVFAMPSLYEGFGLPLLEAMSCGCPVITSRAGSLPEVGGDAPFYINEYDIVSITKAISELFSNEKLQKKLSDKGLTQAKNFSWEKTAKDTYGVYGVVIENK